MSRLTSSIAFALSLLALTGGAMLAQSPEQRQELETFRDSLSKTQDTVGLLELEKRMINVAKQKELAAVIRSMMRMPSMSADRQRMFASL